MNRQKIFYLCPEFNEPTGGIKVIYRHVDLLNESGVPAFVVHNSTGYRCTWFGNTTEIIPLSSMRPAADDLIVIPAIWGNMVNSFFPGIRKVILNQGCYLTFQGYPVGKEMPAVPYRHRDVVATLVVSDDSREYLEYAFPGIPVYKVRNCIDTGLFSYVPEKENCLAFMLRKRYQDIEQVINILKYRGALDDFELVPIAGVGESEVAAIMQRSKLFMNFCDGEGWGLPVAEAMSCGAIVAGYHGFGGRELFDPGFTYPVEQGDVLSFSRTVESILEADRKDPGKLQAMSYRASEFIRSGYTAENTKDDLAKFLESVERLPAH